MATRPPVAGPTGRARPLTYGLLITTAAADVTAARDALRGRPLFIAQLVDHAAAIGRVLDVAARHARHLAGPLDGTTSPPARLAHTLTTATANHPLWAPPVPPHGTAARWHRAADLLGTAHHILASHTGPDGQPRGPNATLLTDIGAVTGATGALARLATAAASTATSILTVADHHPGVVDDDNPTTASVYRDAARAAPAHRRHRLRRRHHHRGRLPRRRDPRVGRHHPATRRPDRRPARTRTAPAASPQLQPGQRVDPHDRHHRRTRRDPACDRRPVSRDAMGDHVPAGWSR